MGHSAKICFWKNVRNMFGLFLFFVLIALPSVCLSENGKNVSMSVTIFDPFNCYFKIVAEPEKTVPNFLYEGHVNKQTEGTLYFVASGQGWQTPENQLFQTAKETGDTGQTEYANAAPGGVCGQQGDVVYKTKKHLARRLSGVEMTGVVTFDFTQNGACKLYAGDVNLTDGDNKINAMDMSILVSDWNGVAVRADLNGDSEVNSLDSSILLANFNMTGD